MPVPVPAPAPRPSSPEQTAVAPSPAPRALSVHRRALLTWVAVYPTITVALLLLHPLIGGLPAAVQTLVLTAVVVPPVVYVLLPALVRLDARLPRRRSA